MSESREAYQYTTQCLNTHGRENPVYWARYEDRTSKLSLKGTYALPALCSLLGFSVIICRIHSYQSLRIVACSIPFHLSGTSRGVQTSAAMPERTGREIHTTRLSGDRATDQYLCRRRLGVELVLNANLFGPISLSVLCATLRLSLGRLKRISLSTTLILPDTLGS